MPRSAPRAIPWPARIEAAGGPTRPPLTPEDLRAWRQGVGLTIREVEAWLGIDRSTWGHWVGGRRPIPPMLDLALMEIWRRVGAGRA